MEGGDEGPGAGARKPDAEGAMPGEGRAAESEPGEDAGVAQAGSALQRHARDDEPEGQGKHEAQPLSWVTKDAFAPEECPVCFETMGGACPVRRLACGHGFHHACIQRWLQQSASCPLCKADTPAPPAPAPGFRVDLGHQEMAQIMTELEDIFAAIHQCAGPDRPIALSGLTYNLCVSLGYEDEDELEEAIGGTLADFLSALPHFEVHWPSAPEAWRPHGVEWETATEATAAGGKSDEHALGPALEAVPAAADAAESPAAEGRAAAAAVAAPGAAEAPEGEGQAPRQEQEAQALEPEIRATMRPEPTAAELVGRPGARIRFTVASREDLWRVVLQGPRANLEIEELEFVIRPKERRRIDTVYNMIASAVFHLGDHVQKNTRAGTICDDEITKICAAIDDLNVLLDLEQPFTIVLEDPQGISELKPMDGAHVGPLLEPVTEEPDAADRAAG